MNEEKVSAPSMDEFLHGIKSGTGGVSTAWVLLAALLFRRRGGFND